MAHPSRRLSIISLSRQAPDAFKEFTKQPAVGIHVSSKTIKLLTFSRQIPLDNPWISDALLVKEVKNADRHGHCVTSVGVYGLVTFGNV